MVFKFKITAVVKNVNSLIEETKNLTVGGTDIF